MDDIHLERTEGPPLRILADLVIHIFWLQKCNPGGAWTPSRAAAPSSTCAAWRAQNPDCEYQYFNDTQCAAFLSTHFGDAVVQAFHTLRPGAFKADLFRYAYLYVRGGVYVDLDMAPVPGHTIDSILRRTPHAAFVACVERPGICGVWQGFMACVPGIAFLNEAVNMIVHHTQIRYYPPSRSTWDGILSITGPALLARVMPSVAFRAGAQRVSGVPIHLHAFDDHVRDEETQEILISGEGADYSPNDNYGYLTLHRQVYA